MELKVAACSANPQQLRLMWNLMNLPVLWNLSACFTEDCIVLQMCLHCCCQSKTDGAVMDSPFCLSRFFFTALFMTHEINTFLFWSSPMWLMHLGLMSCHTLCCLCVGVQFGSIQVTQICVMRLMCSSISSCLTNHSVPVVSAVTYSSISTCTFACLAFLIHMGNIWTCVISCHLTDQLTDCPSCVAKVFNVGHYEQSFQPNSFIPAISLGRCHWLLPFEPFGLRVTGSAKHKVCWVYFLTHLSDDQNGICCMEAVEVDHPDPTLKWVVFNQGNSRSFSLQITSNNCKVYMRSGFY